jgi:hypothetical protein
MYLVRRFSLAFVVALSLFIAVQPAAACVHRPPTPPHVWIYFQSPTFALVIVHRYTTALVGPGQFCACGLKTVGPIQKVNQLVVTNSNTGQLVPGFGFQPNTFVGRQFAAASGTSGAWTGFLSPITATVPSGTPVDLMYGITVPPGTTFKQVATALAAQGLIGNDEAASDGTLLIDHLQITRPGEIGELKAEGVPQDREKIKASRMPKPRS